MSKKTLILSLILLAVISFARRVDASELYDVKTGDNLWLIAERIYGDGHLWHSIFEANNLSYNSNNNPLIYRGDTLVLPTLKQGLLLDNPISTRILENELSDVYDSFRVSFNLYRLKFDNEEDNEQFKSLNYSVRALNINPPEFIGPSDKHISVAEDYQYFEDPESAFNSAADVKVPGTQYTCFKKEPVLNYNKSDYFIVSCSANSSGTIISRIVFKEGKTSDWNDRIYAVIFGDVLTEWYDFVDQLSYSPIKKEIGFRARIGDDWYAIRGLINKSNDHVQIFRSNPYHYVETAFYTTDGDFHIVARGQDDRWVLVSNDKTTFSADFIDNPFYIKRASDFVYRANLKDHSGDTRWFVVLGNKKSTEWDYVDLIFYDNLNDKLYYRAINNGKSLIVEVDHGNSEVVDFVADKNDEIVEYSINPVSGKIVVTLRSHTPTRYLYINQSEEFANRKYVSLGELRFSPDGKHFTFWGLNDYPSDDCDTQRKICGINKSVDAEFVLDNKYYKKVRFYDSNELDVPFFITSGFDEDDNLVIYTRKNNNIIREVYDISKL